MKKCMLLFITVLLIFSMTACEPLDFFYSYDDLKDQVEAVELIHYDNPDAKTIYKSEKDKVLLPFDFEKMEVVEVLPAEKIDDFLQDLSKVQFFRDMGHPDSPNGQCIRVVYRNGDFEILNDAATGSYAGSFDAKGNVKRFSGVVAYSLEHITTKYFDTQFES